MSDEQVTQSATEAPAQEAPATEAPATEAPVETTPEPSSKEYFEEAHTKETETEQPTTQTTGYKGKPSNFIDLDTATKDEIKQRFSSLYGKQKSTERMLRQVQQNYDAVSDVVNDFYKERDDQGKAEELTALEDRVVELQEMGDYRDAMKAQQELHEMRMAHTEAEQVNYVQKKQEERLENMTDDERAVYNLSDDDLQALQQWRYQKGQNGQPLRPWAQDGHASLPQARDLLKQIASEPKFQNAEIVTILREADQRIANYQQQNINTGAETKQQPQPKQQQRQAPAVMSGNTSVRQSKDAEVGLNDIERATAAKQFPDLSRKAAHKKYLDSKKEILSTEVKRNDY